MSGFDAISKCVECLARACRAEGRIVVVLRRYDDLPAVGNDLDLLVPSVDADRVEELLLQTARNQGLERYMRLERSAGSPITHRFFATTSRRSLVVDLFTDLNWWGFPYLSADRLLANRLGGPVFDVPRPAHEAVAVVLGKVLHGVGIPRDRLSRVKVLREADAMEFRRCLDEALGASMGPQVERKVARGDEVQDRALTRRARWALAACAIRRHPIRTLGGVVRQFRRIGRRVRTPGGVFVVLLGADGSGKSTVAHRLSRRLAARFPVRPVRHFHWKPIRSLPRRATGPVTSPYDRPSRGRAASTLFLLRHWFDFVVGSWFGVMPALFVGGAVVGERYYQDMLLDPRRYRLAASRSMIVFLGRAVRRPDLYLCLDAPVETLRARKQEVCAAETRSQAEAVREFADRTAEAMIVDVDRPLEAILDDCEERVLRTLALRQATASVGAAAAGGRASRGTS